MHQNPTLHHSFRATLVCAVFMSGCMLLVGCGSSDSTDTTDQPNQTKTQTAADVVQDRANALQE